MTRRPRTAVVTGTVVIGFIVASLNLNAQNAPGVFNGTDLAGWRVERTKADVREGVLHVGEGNGWVRTERPYVDFVMKMEARLPKDGEAGIFVRAWPTFTSSGSPSNGFRLRLSAPDTPTADGWIPLEVECVGGSLRVRLNGTLVHSVDDIENPQGHVAFWSSRKEAQFKNIDIRRLPRARTPVVPSPTDDPRTVEAGPGVVSPKPVQQRPFPRYTADALRARITGTVVLSAVVTTDGAVSNVAVVQSLDPKYGLDREAVDVARRWRFEPGTRAGEPVPVRVAIEFDFNLK